MRASLDEQLAAPATLSLAQLRIRWTEVSDGPVPRVSAGLLRLPIAMSACRPVRTLQRLGIHIVDAEPDGVSIEGNVSWVGHITSTLLVEVRAGAQRVTSRQSMTSLACRRVISMLR